MRKFPQIKSGLAIARPDFFKYDADRRVHLCNTMFQTAPKNNLFVQKSRNKVK